MNSKDTPDTVEPILSTVEIKKRILYSIELDAVLRSSIPMQLACGKRSNVVIDMSRVLRTYDFQVLLQKYFSQNPIPDDVDFDGFGGPMSASDIICSAYMFGVTSSRKHPRRLRFFGIRKEEKNRGFDNGFVTGYPHLNKVVLFEDVCTSGGTLIKAANTVEQKGIKVVGVFALFDRGGLKHVVDHLNQKHGTKDTFSDSILDYRSIEGSYIE